LRAGNWSAPPGPSNACSKSPSPASGEGGERSEPGEGLSGDGWRDPHPPDAARRAPPPAFAGAGSLPRCERGAIWLVSDAIAKGNIRAINYFVAQRYVEALQRIASAPNHKVILMPLEAVSVIGAIGGIGELAREAMAGQGAAQKGPWEKA
jgi:hypothetical protein